MTDLENTLRAHLFRATCPDALTLGEYQSGLLADDAAVHAHVTGCPHCAREVALIQRYIDPRPIPASAPRRRSRWRVVVGQLLTGDGQPALAVRGDVQEPQLFLADGVQVALTVMTPSAEPDQRNIVGLVVGGTVETVDFWRDDALTASVTVDDGGAFALDSLASGRYDLILKSAELLITLADVNI